MPDLRTTSAAPVIADPNPDRPRPARISPLSTYRTLLRWTFAGIGSMLPLIIVVQALLAAGIIIGFGFLIPVSDTATVLFLSTGAPTILVLTLGFVMVPQGVAQARTNGTFDYMRSLPIARPLLLAAEMTVWLIVALPSIAVSILVAHWRYGLTFSIDWPLLAASSILVAVMATAVGYGIAVSLPPLIAQLISQVLVFFVMLFSPITFAADRLPDWFATVHDYLPVRPGADLLRAGLASDMFGVSTRDLLVLIGWCLIGITLTWRALVRRA